MICNECIVLIYPTTIYKKMTHSETNDIIKSIRKVGKGHKIQVKNEMFVLRRYRTIRNMPALVVAVYVHGNMSTLESHLHGGTIWRKSEKAKRQSRPQFNMVDHYSQASMS
jgi:hypothetical protein